MQEEDVLTYSLKAPEASRMSKYKGSLLPPRFNYSPKTKTFLSK